MSSTTTAQPTCTAWRRPSPGRPWVKLFDAEGLDAAWEQLLAQRLGGDVCVMPVGRSPNERRSYAAGGRRML